jgi:enediyne biosynthesis protein E4
MRASLLALLVGSFFLPGCGSDAAAPDAAGGSSDAQAGAGAQAGAAGEGQGGERAAGGAGPAGGSGGAAGEGGAGGAGGAAGTGLCQTAALVEPTSDFFKDISGPSGIQDENFVPMPATPIPINDHSRLAFADIDGDGFDDLVAHSLFPNAQAGVPFEHLVFRNKGDGTFENFSDASGLRGVQAGFFIFGDIDNDGDQDVFAGLDVPLPGLTHHVFLNDGQGHFSVVEKSGIEGSANNTVVGSASFADFNNDGKLDVYLANGQTSYPAADQLYLGNGDGTFKNATASSLKGGNPQRPSNGVVVCDYDGDGDQDIFVSTYGVSVELGHNILWENDGAGVFKNVAEERGFAAQPEGNYWLATTDKGTTPEPGKDASNFVGSNGFGIDCDDIDGDGLDDIYLATISHPVTSDYSRKWSDPSQLLINQGPAGGFAFKNEFLARGLPFNEGDIDAAIADFDNDGRLDLSVTRDNKYEGGYTTDDQRSWLGLLRQGADGTFTSVGLTSGINDLEGAGLPRMKAGQNLAWSDIDNDGDLDLVVGGRDHGGGRANFLFENTIGSKNTWLAVRLTGDGQKVNRDAIGARVTLKFPGRSVSRVVKSSRGTYSSADTRALHFGLGDLGCAFSLEVRWPDGKLTTLDGSALPSNTFLKIDYAGGLLEGAGAGAQ